MEAVEGRGAALDELAAVADQRGEVVWSAGEAGGGQVVVACRDAGDLQGVDGVGLGAGTPAAAGRGGHLRGHLHHRHPSADKGFGGWAAVVAGALDDAGPVGGL